MTDYEQVPFTDRADWLAKRRTGIGASDIAAIMGISPWSTPFQVWVSKMTDDAPETELNEDMLWGVRMEGAILDEFEERSDLWVAKRGELIRNVDRPWMMATPDGITASPSEVVEAKKTSDWSWDEIPTHYQIQVQWQLAVTGLDKGYLVALHQGRHLEIYPIEADPDMQTELIAAGEAFWNLVESGTPPAVGGDDNAFMATLYPTSSEVAVEISSEIIEELRAAKDNTKTAKTRQDAAEATLKELMGGADTAVVGQNVVATWKTQSRSGYEVKPGTSRVLRVREPKT